MFYKILLVTEGPIDISHGTGVQLTRIFSTREGPRILHVTPEGHEGGPFERISLKRAFEQNITCKTVIRAWNKFSLIVLRRTPAWKPKYISGQLKLMTNRFRPDLVLGVVYSNTGLRLMQAVLEASGRKPAVLWFQDLQLIADSDGRVRDLERILYLLSEVWTLSPPMMEWLKGAVGRWPGQLRTRVRPHWCVPVSDCYRRAHRKFSSDFRCIMLGNVWDYRMIPVAKQLWRECQDKLPGLVPVQWICHEAGVRRIMNRGIELGPEIEWAGEAAEDRLHETLVKADLAIVPFSVDIRSDYARFSLPSKLGELAAIGMPMVILAGSRTATTRYVTEFRIGELLTELGQDHWSIRLCEIISNVCERARLSASARNYAERHLDQDKFRNEIFEELRSAAFESST
jgi:hypothetical protein